MLQQFPLPARNSNRHLVIDLRIDVHQGGWILIRILGSATVFSLENSGAYCNHTLWCKNTTIVISVVFLQGKSVLMAQAKKVHLLWCHPASKLLKSQLTFFNGQRDLHMYQQKFCLKIQSSNCAASCASINSCIYCASLWYLRFHFLSSLEGKLLISPCDWALYLCMGIDTMLLIKSSIRVIRKLSWPQRCKSRRQTCGGLEPVLERYPPLSPPGVATALATAVVSKPQASSSRFSPSSADALQYPPQRSLNRILSELADPLPPLLPLSELLSELHRPLLLAADFFPVHNTELSAMVDCVVDIKWHCSSLWPSLQLRSCFRNCEARFCCRPPEVTCSAMALCDPGIAFAALSFLEIFAARLLSVDQIEFETVSRNSRNLSNELLTGTIYLCNSVKSLESLLCINASLFERQTVTHCLRIESMHENIDNDFLKNKSPRSVIICLQSYKLWNSF